MVLTNSKTGERLVRSVTVKVFRPGNKTFKAQHFNAGNRTVDEQGKPAGRPGYTPHGVQLILERVSEALAEHFPGHEFRLVELAPGRFNIVHESYPAPAAPADLSAVTATMAMAAAASGRGRYQTVAAT